MLCCPKCHRTVSPGASSCANTNCGAWFTPSFAPYDVESGETTAAQPGVWSRVPEPVQIVIAAVGLALGVPAITLLSVWVFPIAWVVCFAAGLGLGGALPERPRIPLALPVAILTLTVASFGVVLFGDFRFGRDGELLLLIGLASINLSLVLFGVIHRRKRNNQTLLRVFLSLCAASLVAALFGPVGLGLVVAALIVFAVVNAWPLIRTRRRQQSEPSQD